MKYQIKSLVIAGLGLLAGNAQASLTEIAPGLVYDDVRQLTWLQDANYVKTSGFDADGRLTWAAANAWANGLTFAGVSGWSLPGLTDNSVYVGKNSGNSQLAHLFYHGLGGQSEHDLSVTHNSNYALFENVQASVYWMKDELVVPGVLQLGWGFVIGNGVLSGHQNLFNESSEFKAWAVHAGDIRLQPNYIAPESIPVPAAAWLFGTGLLGLIGAARKRVLA